MPGMVVFDRRWAIATDDFLLVGIVETSFFLAWFCWTAVIFSSYLKITCPCPVSTWCPAVLMFFVVSCFLFAVNALLASAYIFFSTQGTISEPGLRRRVKNIVQLKFILSVLDFFWACGGTMLIIENFDCGHFDALRYVKIITICMYFVLAVRIAMYWVFYDPRGRIQKRKKLRKMIPSEYLSPAVPSGSSRKWRYRFQAFCLWFTAPSEDRRVAIGTVSDLLAFLSHDVDLVASDLIAGLILYRQKCLKQYRSEAEKMKFVPGISLQDGTAAESFPTADMPKWMNLQLASHYFGVGMGVFGWAWAIFRNISCGLCELFKKCVFCLPCRQHSYNVVGDNCCGCNLAGLLTTSGYMYQDIVHASFVNRVYQIPFYVALDHQTSSVVLTARGSMSCADALTDLAAAFEPIDDCGCPKDSLCHGGMLMAARRIKAKLEEKKVLEKAFSGNENYRLVVTGHSLGAGVASLLTLMYKNTYPDVCCFAFAPPPVLNEVALPETFDCVFTVIYGSDVVPYLNYWNIRGMIVTIVDLLEHCKLPKHKILLGCQRAYSDDEEEQTEQINTNANLDVERRGDEDNEIAVDKRENEENSSGPHESNSFVTNVEGKTRFFIPGRILQIKHSKKYGYRLRICKAEDFQPLLCKKKMVVHHFPWHMETSLKYLGQTDKVLSQEIVSEPEGTTPVVVRQFSASAKSGSRTSNRT